MLVYLILDLFRTGNNREEQGIRWPNWIGTPAELFVIPTRASLGYPQRLPEA
jgi:hypothetical protein